MLLEVEELVDDIEFEALRSEEHRKQVIGLLQSFRDTQAAAHRQLSNVAASIQTMVQEMQSREVKDDVDYNKVVRLAEEVLSAVRGIQVQPKPSSFRIVRDKQNLIKEIKVIQ